MSTPFDGSWGTFALATSLPNVAGAPIQSSRVRTTDYALVGATPATMTLYHCHDATVGAAVWTQYSPSGGGGGGSGTVLFEWDPTIAVPAGGGQFDAGAAFAGPGLVTASLTRVANVAAPYGQLLRLASTGLGTASAVWLATVPLPAGTYDFEIQAEVFSITPAAQYGGFEIFAEVVLGNLFGYAYLGSAGGGGWRHRVDDGVLVTDGSTPSGLAHPEHWSVIVEGEKLVGSIANFTVSGMGRRSATSASASYWHRADYAGEPAPATWNPLTSLRWGLTAQASGGNPMPTVDFGSLRVIAR
jgi:hypothetical protein